MVITFNCKDGARTIALDGVCSIVYSNPVGGASPVCL